MSICLGTCSLCGGRVTVTDIWHGVNPPMPTCERCHATPKQHGPVTEREPPRTAGNFVLADGRVFPCK